MAIDTNALCTQYETQYSETLAKLAALPASSVSDQGRSTSPQRADLQKQLDWLAQQLAALGRPIGGVTGIGMPFQISETMRPR